jgi:hypothetical protein
MEMMSQNTQIIFGDNSNRIIRQTTQSFCFLCQKKVGLLTFEQTAKLFKTDVGNIYPLTRKTGLHLLHNRKGAVMVCENAVMDILRERQMLISKTRIITLKPLN